MKKAALVLGFLALAACSASSEGDADTLTAAVKKDAPAAEAAPVSESSPPASAEPAGPTAPTAPTTPTETCASLRAKPARGTFSFDWVDDDDAWEIPWVDVDAHLDHTVTVDGEHRYSVTLIFSNVKNLALYSTFGGAPVHAEYEDFRASVVHATEVDNPFQGTIHGNTGLRWESECKDGGTSALGSSVGSAPIRMTILENEGEGGFLEGNFEIWSVSNLADPPPSRRFVTVHFRAPIAAKQKDATGFRTKPVVVAPVCCKLAD